MFPILGGLARGNRIIIANKQQNSALIGCSIRLVISNDKSQFLGAPILRDTQIANF